MKNVEIITLVMFTRNQYNKIDDQLLEILIN